jgi:Reverse transcriptase (RNA-dependent DNA polymerase)
MRLMIFFVTVGSNLAGKIPSTGFPPASSYLSGSYPDSFQVKPTDPEEVIALGAALSNKSSFGADEIPVFILKHCIIHLAPILSDLINYSFSSGHFPTALKIAKVCPIYKSGPHNLVSNFRPISILPSVSKLYEKAMHKRLNDYLTSKKVLLINQYGFREKHSSYMAILDLYDKISKACENNLVTVGIFIDLQKAFDSLDHSILLSKLEFYGIRGIVLKWFTSYLKDRSQYVVYNKVCSSLKPITYGVPQGSILGPMLFILFINDIANCSHLLYPILFADDTNLLLSDVDCNSLIAKLNPELIKLSSWFCANKLTLNVTKTNYMLFGVKRTHNVGINFKVVIDGKIIDRVSTVKFLGVQLDDDLNWKAHVDYISLKIAKSLGAMNRVKYILNNVALRTLYNSLIHPYLSYCIILWGGASITAVDKALKMQKRAIRLISGSRYCDHTAPLFSHSRILRLHDLYCKEILIFMYKLKNRQLPECCMNYIMRAIPKPYAFRSNDYFNIEYAKCRIRLKSIACVGPRLWNTCPDTISSLDTLTIFKNQLHSSYVDTYV